MNYCRHKDAYIIVKTIINNGSIQVRQRCEQCGELFGGPLPHANFEIDEMPFYETGYPKTECAVVGCTNTDVELNHYFPRALARKVGEDADGWPTGYLCRYHHRLWHRNVTPGLLPEKDVTDD